MGFAIAILAGTLFGVGGTFAQFLFQQRGVDVGWLVTMRLLFGGIALLLISAVSRGRAVLAVWRQDGMPLILFGLIGMMPVQYTYMAAIGASNTATATVLQFTSPAMVAAWLAATRRKRPEARDVAAVALAMLGTFFLAAHGRLGALSISAAALFWGLASAVAAAFNSLQPAGLLKRHGAAVVAGWGMLIGGVALSCLHAPWNVQGMWDGRAYDRAAEDDPSHLCRAAFGRSACRLVAWRCLGGDGFAGHGLRPGNHRAFGEGAIAGVAGREDHMTSSFSPSAKEILGDHPNAA
jgi:drug/metabolite transporter (DMT)-like permease